MGILFIMVVKVAQIKNKKYREDHCYASRLIFYNY